MKKILIIGASILQLPGIKKAKELGYYVGVADYDTNAVGIPYADEYFEVSTIDIEKIVDIAKKFNPDGIMTLATDMPMRSVSRATEVCGCVGIPFDTAIKATDKGEMIKAFANNNVAHPWYYIVQDEEAFARIKKEINYPCIIKPVDNAGSRGVSLINNLSELENAYVCAVQQSRHGSIIIEEYMEGLEVSVEVLVLGGIPNVIQVTDKITTGAPHFVEMGHTQPSRLCKQDINNITDLAKRAVKSVGINCGPAHVEIMLTKNGPKMIELGARMGGDCITTHLVPLSTGIDMVRNTIEIACGISTDITPRINKGAAIRFLSANKGVIKDITGVEEAKKIDGIIEVCLTKKVGETVGDVNSSADRLGFVISQGETAEEAEHICQQALELIKIEIK